LLRADGFALFIAVCNSALTVKELIRLLQESMPGVEIETVTLDKEVTQPLDAVLAQVRPEGRGPVMVLGLDASNPSSARHHPVLQALNLGRAEWPAKLPRPVVFWIPEYLLGYLGREAPDFLDWRSDTLFFRTPPREDLRAFDSGLWISGVGENMSLSDRLDRMERLRQRLEGRDGFQDDFLWGARLSWLVEMAYHDLLLGKLEEAEKAHRKALQMEEQLGWSSPAANSYLHLGVIAQTRGDYAQARQWYERALDIKLRQGLPAETAALYHQLGDLYWELGEDAQAEAWYRKALDTFAALGVRAGAAALDYRKGVTAQENGDFEAAEKWYRKAAEVLGESGNRIGLAATLRRLGSLACERGDLARAEGELSEALTIDEALGHARGLAATYAHLGLLHEMKGELDEAAEAWGRARDLYHEMGAALKAEMISKWLDALPPSRARQPRQTDPTPHAL
jgi:tetratricopeptide (TPR) repeat protein